ncbi:hypothetical protein GIB67_032044 [Kingdonia uniflora]|uniref:Uncharacterized protein n=1 Tax=Kingdonia uniflora TaxID=39325 RepID=A0A7J7MWL7_9MAGN|nr:hypothetical protein GIB67_032044 [Kingdonia uniflora]
MWTKILRSKVKQRHGLVTMGLQNSYVVKKDETLVDIWLASCILVEHSLGQVYRDKGKRGKFC